MPEEKSQVHITAFKNLDPYEGIEEAELCAIAPNAVDQVKPGGTLLYDCNHSAKGIYVIESGEVVLSYSDEDGKEVIFDTLGPGGVFGDFGFNDGKPTHAAKTTRKTMLCITPVDEFLNIVATKPEIMLRFMKAMALRIHEYETRLRTSTGGARERVLAELVRLREKQRRRLIGRLKGVPLVAITHEELAKKTGLNRVTVTRAVNSLKDEGLIRQEKNGKGYEIPG